MLDEHKRNIMFTTDEPQKMDLKTTAEGLRVKGRNSGRTLLIVRDTRDDAPTDRPYMLMDTDRLLFSRLHGTEAIRLAGWVIALSTGRKSGRLVFDEARINGTAGHMCPLARTHLYPVKKGSSCC
mgnify:CR=1 FL=1